MFKQALKLLRETIKEWQEDGAAAIAAALAYYTIFSLSPLLILIALLIGIVLDQNTLDEQVFTDLEGTVGLETTNTLRNIIDNSEQRNVAETSFPGTVIWFSVVIWGASGVFTQLQNALNRIWEVKAMPGRSPLVFFKNRFLSLLVVFSVGTLLIATLVINTTVNLLVENFSEAADIAFLIRPLQFIITMGMLTILFALIYKILPDVIMRWKDVWVGAAFTALLFFIGQFVVGLYLSNADPGSVFGAAGSLTIILVWIYYSAQIMLFGAEFTEVWARHHGAYIRPDDDAVWINEAQARREAAEAGITFEEETAKSEPDESN